MTKLSHPAVILVNVNDQLALIETVPEPSAPAETRGWELDDHTREVGRRGVALAREALRQGASRQAA